MQKVRWLELGAGPECLRIERADSGWPALAQVKAGGMWYPVALHISLVIDSGEGRDDPDECRIEPPTGKSILAPEGRIPIVVGVLAGNPTPPTIVLWDPTPHVNRGTRASLYSKWSAIRLAADKGWYEHINSKSERVIAADLSRLPDYVLMLTVGQGAQARPPLQLAASELGVPFQQRQRHPLVTPITPYIVDSERVERANQAHEDTVAKLASFLVQNHYQPRSPGKDDPEYDLAWEVGLTRFVAEVKSLSDDNEDKQLRLGLGQTLWYRYLLGLVGVPVLGLLVAERQPRDLYHWRGVCAQSGVLLVWPESFGDILSFLR